MVRSDLSQFLDKRRVIRWKASERRQRLGSLLMFILLQEEARRFRQEEKADADDEGPSELDCDGDAVASGVLAVFGAVVDDGREEETLLRSAFMFVASQSA